MILLLMNVEFVTKPVQLAKITVIIVKVVIMVGFYKFLLVLSVLITILEPSQEMFVHPAMQNVILVMDLIMMIV